MFSNVKSWMIRQYMMKKGEYLSCFEKTEPVEFPIDFVVTWVDEHDEAWLKEKNAYLEREGIMVRTNNPDERYRDWDIFKYWFRAVEKYAPWVRKVYLVTCGHIPSWLNTEADKLVVVSHKEFIPEKYLPTFSCNPIELNLHRIPGLSEHFVYFNDDVFLGAPVYPEDFYNGDCPKHCAIAFPLRNDSNDDSFYHQQFTDLGMFNSFWKGKISQTIKEHPEKWFANQYGIHKKHNLTAFDEDYLFGAYFSHLSVPFCKSTFEQVWEDIPEKMDATCMHRFRTAQDVIHQIVSLWELATGHFSPVEKSYFGKVYSDIPRQLEEIEEAFLAKNCRSICLNDTYLMTKEEYRTSKQMVGDIMKKTFPQKSVYEKDV